MIYKVKIQKISTGMRIEGVDCNVYLFKSKDTAFDFAYNKALEYTKENNQMPDNEEIGEKLKMKSIYKWSKNDYGEIWPECLIRIEKDILRLEDDLVQVISLNL